MLTRLRRIVWLLATLLVVVARPVWAQSPPVIQAFQTTNLVVPYTAGTVTVGGTQVSIPLGSITLTDNMYLCNPTQFAYCNFVYWPGSGTVLLATTSLSQAVAPGNAVIAYVTTAGGVITNVVVASLTLQAPDGVFIPVGGMRLQLCNALIKSLCQVSSGSLSGY